jgi:hypothetical protein
MPILDNRINYEGLYLDVPNSIGTLYLDEGRIFIKLNQSIHGKVEDIEISSLDDLHRIVALYAKSLLQK